jgi:arsenate reductase
MKLYGIPNCDTVKKARAWLEAHGVDYEFHDYKKHGVDEALLAKWMKQAGWESVVNRKGITWRKLTDAEKAKVKDDQSAIAFLVEKPSAIKRPGFEVKGKLVLGFDEAVYEKLFGGTK